MKQRNRTQIVVLLLAVLAVGGALSAQSTSDLTWSLAFLKWDKTDYVPQPFARPLKMVNDDAFQVFLRVNSGANVYIIDEKPDGTVDVLYRSLLKAGTPLYLPSEDNDYTIAPPAGTDKLYIIVSIDPQPKFEKLLDVLTSNQGDQTQKAKDVADEIARIKQSTSAIAEAPERPVPIGGVSRGSKSIKATEFHGLTTYVKTIRIDH